MQHVADFKQRQPFFFEAVNDAHPDTEQRRCMLKISNLIKKKLKRHLHHKADETIILHDKKKALKDRYR